MAKKNYHVTKNPDGGWDVKKPHAQRSSGHFDTQNDAFDRARDLAKGNPDGGEVIIHGRNGKIRDKNTYGKDPFPPEG